MLMLSTHILQKCLAACEELRSHERHQPDHPAYVTNRQELQN